METVEPWNEQSIMDKFKRNVFELKVYPLSEIIIERYKTVLSKILCRGVHCPVFLRIDKKKYISQVISLQKTSDSSRVADQDPGIGSIF